MAESEVIVRVGATTDDLKKGIAEANKILKEFQNQIVDAGKRLLELGGIALTLEGFKRLVEQSAELGESIEKSSQILGISTDEVQKLGFMATVSGSSLEAMRMVMGRFEIGLAEAQKGSGRVAEGLRAMGMQAKDLISLPWEKQLGVIADWFAAHENGANKAAIAQALFNRNGINMIPVLNQGSAGIEEMGKRLEAAGGIMSEDTVKSLKELNDNIKLLTAAMMASAGFGIAKLWESLKVISKGFKDAADEGIAFEARVQSIGDTAAKVKIPEITVSKPPSALLPTPAIPVVDPTAMEKAKEAIKIADQYYKQNEIGATELVKTFAASEAQKTGMLLTALDVRVAATLAALEKEKAASAGDPKELSRIEAEKTQVVTVAETQRMKIRADAKNRDIAQWQAVGNEISGLVTKELRGLIEGTTTVSAAFANMFKNLIVQIAEAIVQMEILTAIMATYRALSMPALSAGAGGLTGLQGIFAGMIPHFQQGSAFTTGGLAMLHPGEMVIPPSFSDQIRAGTASLGGGSGGQATINISALDAASVASLFRGPTGQAITAGVAQAMTRNPNLRPSY